MQSQPMYGRHSRESGNLFALMQKRRWIPAFAGMTAMRVTRHIVAIPHIKKVRLCRVPISVLGPVLYTHWRKFMRFKTSFLTIALASVSLGCASVATQAQTAPWTLSGALVTHDPDIQKEGSTYWIMET